MTYGHLLYSSAATVSQPSICSARLAQKKASSAATLPEAQGTTLHTSLGSARGGTVHLDEYFENEMGEVMGPSDDERSRDEVYEEGEKEEEGEEEEEEEKGMLFIKC